ncbi:hypothetical protein [Clostridium estertheticum]|uniref:hypothetical protein n=1 Tax=Clostridium estertheticum TaxID=238834 RepID=UPI001C7D8A58|nr:hypothetical protein [Clostridium estertheticum]MBX4266554.1 hypothetical protein [Clostridium estertheticum]WLC88106.1 hypothetical protein KTC95_19125 [Clostridium estertheticum]
MKYLKNITGLVLMVLAFFYVLYIPSTNQNMTNIQLLINFWKNYLVICIMLISGYFLANYHHK